MNSAILFATVWCAFSLIDTIVADAGPTNEVYGGTNPILNVTVDLSKKTWSYKDMPKWGTQFPTCAGSRQSPINLNIRTAKKVIYKNQLRSKYYNTLPYSLTLVNKGYAIDAASTFTNGKIPQISGGPLVGTYLLEGLHWHWGEDETKGSEHTVNGKSLPIELHFVHYSSKFDSITAAVASGESEAIAVVGVRFKVWDGPSNYGMYLVAEAMRDAETSGKQSTYLPLAYFGLNFKRTYFSYLGSLTVPPCQEIVRWIFLDTPLYMNYSEAEMFWDVLVNGQPLININRDVQPLNGRIVTYNVGPRCNW